jgi:hypothetical protein
MPISFNVELRSRLPRPFISETAFLIAGAQKLDTVAFVNV